MRRPLIVFVGGGIGASLRAGLLAWLAPWSAVLPVPVLIANVLGAFVLAVVVVLANEAGLLGADTRLFLAVGVLGGFTTFSTFGWGADLLLAHGAHWGAGVIYLVASMIGGVVAVYAGLTTGRGLVGALERTPIGLPERVSRRGPRRADGAQAQADMATIETEDREEPA